METTTIDHPEEKNPAISNQSISESTTVSRTWFDVPQFLRNNNALLGIVQSVFNVGIGIQMVSSLIWTHGVFDGIRSISERLIHLAQRH
jgi:hypothetical protein